MYDSRHLASPYRHISVAVPTPFHLPVRIPPSTPLFTCNSTAFAMFPPPFHPRLPLPTNTTPDPTLDVLNIAYPLKLPINVPVITFDALSYRSVDVGCDGVVGFVYWGCVFVDLFTSLQVVRMGVVLVTLVQRAAGMVFQMREW